MRKTSFLWILPLIFAVVFMGCPDDQTDNLKTLTAANTTVNVTAAATSGTAQFVGAKGLTLAAADFTLSGTGSGTISNVTVEDSVASVTVTFAANTDTAAGKTFIVGIAGKSKKIKGSATVTINQAAASAPGDTRVTLLAGPAVNAAFADTSANVIFTGADSLSSIPAANFTFSSGLTAGTITVNAGTVTIPVTFTANNTSASRTFTVGINQSSQLINGTTSVTITQAGDTRPELTTSAPAIDVEASATSANVVFTGAGSLSSIAASNFVIGAGLTAGTITVNAGTVTIPVTFAVNAGPGTKTYSVSISQTSTVIKGTASVTITQADPNDTRPLITAGDSVKVTAEATTADVTFTGAAGLNTGDLAAADFTFSTGLNTGAITVSAGTVTITVTFDPNTASADKTYTVGISASSTKIRGSTSVTITQEGISQYSYVFQKVDFEDIAAGNFNGAPNWLLTGGNNLMRVIENPVKTGNTSDKVYQFNVDSQSGGRSDVLVFTNATNTVESAYNRHGVAFDWYPATHNRDNGYLAVRDNTGNQYIAFYIRNTGDDRIMYRVGNFVAGTDGEVSEATLARRVGTGIFDTEKWYHFEVIVDTTLKIIDLTIIDLASGEIAFEETHIPFADDVTYGPGIASLRFFAWRMSGNSTTWLPAIDNLELFRDQTDTPAPATAPQPVTDLACTEETSGGAVLKWSRTVRATGYKVYYTPSTDANYSAAPDITQGAGITLTGLTNNTQYKAKVVAYNSVGDALDSNEITFTPQGLPEQAANFQCTDAYNGQADFIWTAAARATTYLLFVAAAGSEYPANPVDAGNVTAYTIPGLVNGTQYKAKIVASNASGDAAASSDVTFTPVLLDYQRVIPKAHFENFAIGDFPSYIIGVNTNENGIWTTRRGLQGTQAGQMDQLIIAPPGTGNTSRQVLVLQSNGGGPRASQLNFINPTNTLNTTVPKHGIAFDWYPGQPESNGGGYLGIQDGNTAVFRDSDPSTWDNQFIAFYVTSAGAMSYKVGNPPVSDTPSNMEVNSAAAKEGSVAIPEITDLNKWYRLKAVIDMSAKTINVTFTDLDTGAVVVTLTDIAFAAGIEYKSSIASIRFLRERSGGNPWWRTYIDNLELFRYGEIIPPADSGKININVNIAAQAASIVSGHSAEFNKADGTKDITITNFDTAAWYLDGAAVPFTGKTYTLHLSGLRLGNHFLTVVVKVGGVEYSTKFDFKVN